MIDTIVLQTVILAVMFIEAFIVLIRRHTHFRVTRAIRPFFLADSHYCSGVRRFRTILTALIFYYCSINNYHYLCFIFLQRKHTRLSM